MKPTAWIALVLACLPAAQAQAVEEYRTMGAHAPAACKPYSPTAAVRYSASGLRNVGSTSIYVICSLPGRMTGQVSGDNPDGLNRQQNIQFTNPGNKDVSITCRMLSGPPKGNGQTNGSPSYSDDITVKARSENWFGFYYTFTQGMTQHLCLVPPGVELNGTYRTYHEVIGNQ